MYLVSPFYIKFLYNHPNRAWLTGIVISTISILINLAWIISFRDMDAKTAATEYWWKVYAVPWCRLSPYIFGMIVALEHRADKERKIFGNSWVTLEWLATFFFIMIGFSGW
jgi:hypothetical protein